MHEFSLAQSVHETIISIATQRNAKEIKRIILKFGSFALVQEDQFRFCFDIIKKDSPVTLKSELEIIWIPGELRCFECKFQGKITSIPSENNELAPIFECPECKSYSTEIISGTETFIDSIIITE